MSVVRSESEVESGHPVLAKAVEHTKAKTEEQILMFLCVMRGKDSPFFPNPDETKDVFHKIPNPK